MLYKSKKETWMENLLDEFKNESWESILQLMKDVYKIAKNDTDLNNSYTELVLNNLKLITNKENMEITFKQWKSFRAYLKKYNEPKEINESKLL